MISAIAARKAAQATQQQTQQPSQPPSQPSTKSPSSKRRVSSQRTGPLSKKRKRDANKPTKHSDDPTPLFDVSKSQDDVIFINSEDDDDAKLEVHGLSEESDAAILAAPLSHRTARAWSPSILLHDSSSEEDGEADVSGLIDLPARFHLGEESKVGTNLSTFSPIPGKNTFFLSTIEVRELGLDFREEAKGTLVALHKGDRMCLLGTCRITVLRGSISVNGAILYPSVTPHNIFAPRSSPLPVIEYNVSSAKATADDLCLPQSLQSYDSAEFVVILLQELWTNVETLGRVCQTFDGVYELPRSGRENDVATCPFRIDSLYLVNKQTRDLSPFEMPPSWSASLANIPLPPSAPSNPIFLVKGPRKCGKSTFTRALLNMLLSHYGTIAFLDCDPGQSEFTPGGFVSLNVVTRPVFGPPYTHPMLPFRAHFIAATTPKTSPSLYLDGVKDLIDAWRVDVVHLSTSDDADGDERVTDTTPLVINTMGWSKGLGADLIQKIEEMAEPGHVFDFQIDDSFSHSNPPELPFQHHNTNTAQIHVLESAPLSVANYTPADHRSLSILSYFHATFPSPLKSRIHEANFDQLMAQTWDTTLPLCAMRPFEVDVHTAFDQIILSGAGSEDVVPDELNRVLNGALVGFVRLDRPLPFDTSSRADSSSLMVPYIQYQQPPPPSESSCVGLGLVRGVSFPSTSTEDPSSRATLHVLTPVPPTILAGARILVKGEIELPIWGMLDFQQFGSNGDTGNVAGFDKGRVPYLQWGRGPEDAIGAEKRRVRRNLMRRGQA